MIGAPEPLAPLRLPEASEALRANNAWQYYYGPGARFARACSKHVRLHRIAWAAHLLKPVRRPAPGDLLLDVGCGPGESTMLLAEALGPFSRVAGIDVSLATPPLFRAFARTYGSPAAAARGTCTALPIRPGRAALITSFEMVEHVAIWREFVTEAATALRPGGLLLISTPNPRAMHSRLKMLQRRLTAYRAKPYTHYYDFYEEFIPDDALRAAATGAGLEVLELAHGGHVFSFTPDWTIGPSRAAERVLEQRDALSGLAVTTFLVARRP